MNRLLGVAIAAALAVFVALLVPWRAERARLVSKQESARGAKPAGGESGKSPGAMETTASVSPDSPGGGTAEPPSEAASDDYIHTNQLPRARQVALLEQIFAEFLAGLRDAGSLACYAEDFSPEVVLEVMRRRWSEIKLPKDRIQFLGQYSYGDDPAPALLDILDLGMRDPDVNVVTEAISNLQGFVFRDFHGSVEEYAAWRETTQGRPFDDVVAEAARATVAALRAEGSDLDALDELSSHTSPKTGTDALVREGLPSLWEARLARSPDHAADILGHLYYHSGPWSAPIVLPYLKNPDPEVVKAAVKVVAYLKDLERVPALIDALRCARDENAAEAIVAEGLEELTASAGGEQRMDPTFWDAWWAQYIQEKGGE
ncbi:MAG: hypothetical protein K8T20_10920 [Planctomycetes bacterium]|nr:hypothetical protein [Planctomycetota bacterium]